MIISRPIHVPANGVVSSLFTAESYSVVYMHHILIHSFVTGRLGFFRTLTVLNSATMNTGGHAFPSYAFVLNIHPRMGLLDYTAIVLLAF